MAELSDTAVALLQACCPSETAEALAQRAEDVHKQALQVTPYKCVRERRYLRPRLSTHFIYNQIVREISQGKSLLDIGCCMGTDLRKLFVDAKALVPTMTEFPGIGAELEDKFIELGFQLFRDEHVAKNRFLQFNMLERTADGSLPASFAALGQFDYLYEGSVIHLFMEDDIKLFCQRATALLKPGGIFLGRHCARFDQPGIMERSRLLADDSDAGPDPSRASPARTDTAQTGAANVAAPSAGGPAESETSAAGAGATYYPIRNQLRYLHTVESFRALLISLGFTAVDVRDVPTDMPRGPTGWGFMAFAATWPSGPDALQSTLSGAP